MTAGVLPASAAVQVLASSSLQDPSQVDWRTVLPTIVSNMHDYFIAVAAKLERAHTEVRLGRGGGGATQMATESEGMQDLALCPLTVSWAGDALDNMAAHDRQNASPQTCCWPWRPGVVL